MNLKALARYRNLLSLMWQLQQLKGQKQKQESVYLQRLLEQGLK